jgi:hypothetical protein
MVKPNFVIIGDQRSGTTSVTNCFQGHTDVYLYPKLEMEYFNDYCI